MSDLSSLRSCPYDGANEHVYSKEDFQAIAKLVYATAGIVLSDGKSMLVYSRLAKRLREHGLTRFSDYITMLETNSEERKLAVAALTTNHTRFFREGHHFEHFEKHVRQTLVDQAYMSEPVRIWSAGCSSGEEVFSLTMTLLGKDKAAGQQLARKNIAILASDLADHAVDHGTAAQYAREVGELVPDQLKSLWMSETSDGLEMSAIPKSLVRFRQLNLLGQWPFRRPFDVIFCRNTMIYFDNPTKAKLLLRFADQLVPGGYLYIGHSERLVGSVSEQFELVGNTIYRKLGG